jgi:hypothetical protein
VARVVARRPDRGDSGRELDVTAHLFDSVEERHDAALDVRVPGPRERECKRVRMHDVPGAREEGHALEVRVPTEMVDVEVRQQDDIDLGRTDAELLERARQQPFFLCRPVPEARRSDAGVDEDRRLAGADDVAGVGQTPGGAFEELGIERGTRLPRRRGNVGVRLGVVGEKSDRVERGVELDRADYHRACGGAGSPCASSHETTGFRRTPIRSISHSITSPGFR